MRNTVRIIMLVLIVMATSNVNAQQEVNVKTLFHLLPADAFRFLSSNKSADLENTSMCVIIKTAIFV